MLDTTVCHRHPGRADGHSTWQHRLNTLDVDIIEGLAKGYAISKTFARLVDSHYSASFSLYARQTDITSNTGTLQFGFEVFLYFKDRVPFCPATMSPIIPPSVLLFGFEFLELIRGCRDLVF